MKLFEVSLRKFFYEIIPDRMHKTILKTLGRFFPTPPTFSGWGLETTKTIPPWKNKPDSANQVLSVLHQELKDALSLLVGLSTLSTEPQKTSPSIWMGTFGVSILLSQVSNWLQDQWRMERS